jgi:hypothetical protein
MTAPRVGRKIDVLHLFVTILKNVLPNDVFKH